MGNNPVKFSYKQIWFIAYPILISLVMEQLIGMTDSQQKIGSLIKYRAYLRIISFSVSPPHNDLRSQAKLEHFSVSPYVKKAAVSYIRWRVYGFFFSFVAVMFRAFFRGNNPNKDSDTQFDCHGIVECRV